MEEKPTRRRYILLWMNDVLSDGKARTLSEIQEEIYRNTGEKFDSHTIRANIDFLSYVRPVTEFTRGKKIVYQILNTYSTNENGV